MKRIICWLIGHNFTCVQTGSGGAGEIIVSRCERCCDKKQKMVVVPLTIQVTFVLDDIPMDVDVSTSYETAYKKIQSGEYYLKVKSFGLKKTETTLCKRVIHWPTYSELVPLSQAEMQEFLIKKVK